MGKLNAYRMNREASVHAQIRNKKLEKALRFNPENRPLQWPNMFLIWMFDVFLKRLNKK